MLQTKSRPACTFVFVKNMLCAMRDSRLATFFKHLLHRRNTTRGNHCFEKPVLNKVGECRVSIIIELGQTCGDSEDTKAALLTCLRKVNGSDDHSCR